MGCRLRPRAESLGNQTHYPKVRHFLKLSHVCLREWIKDIRFVFQCLAYYDIFSAKPTLKVLGREDVIEKFCYILDLRKSGPVRKYKVFLAIVKALDFAIDGGAEKAASGKLVLDTLKKLQKKKKQHQNVLAVNDPKYPLLGESDYEKLRELCANFITKAAALSQPQKREAAGDVLYHVILMHLVSGAPPRHQVFSKMECRHLIWREEEKSYEIQMDGVDPPLKYGHPILLVLTPRLSAVYQTWMTIFRPLFIQVDSPYVFPNTLGGCQSKFTPGIRTLTLKYLDKKVPISKFRYVFFE